MNRGPKAGMASSADNRTMVEKAAVGWTAVPEWVEELARIADQRGVNGASRVIGYSPAVVSTVIAGKYKGDLGRVEERVRGALMGLTVDCPGLGSEMARNTCLDWQGKPRAATSALRARMYRACRTGCANYRQRGGQNE
jgi:hypothetical protein